MIANAFALVSAAKGPAASGTQELIVQGSYLVASVMFILGLRSLTRPKDARLGMQQAAVGMLFAVIGTLLNAGILTYEWIIIGLVIGAIAGYPMAMKVPMTAMPQFIAFSHAFGAIAATLVGVVEYRHAWTPAKGSGLMPGMSHGLAAALGFEVLFGALTVTGSFMAFGKLQELITGRPITFKGQNAVNLGLMAVAFGCFGMLIVHPETTWAFYAMVGLSLFLGISMVLPIGGGDMPVVVSLLNSYAGLAAAATGFAIGNNVLIIAGALEGAGGFILSMLMSKAMNRSFANIIFGAFGSAPTTVAKKGEARESKTIAVEDAAVQLAYAGSVVIVPGYGMAVAQAQHICRELMELIQKKGGEVKYAIHPVAGRMPGHLNVILSEAGIDYGTLLTDVDDANRVLQSADVAVIIGANDIVNPDAEDDKSSPLYGMPIFRPWTAKTVYVIKRGKGTGFSGVENPLFFRDNTLMLYGDAKKVLGSLVKEIKALDDGH